MDLLKMLFFAVIAAFCAAKLETNVEGRGAWAKNLPTYRFHNMVTSFLMGKRAQMTGYHVWLNISFLVMAHFPFFAGLDWSLSLELRILGVFFFAAALEDFFYYLVNPAFGLKSLNKEFSYWQRFVGPVPVLYITYLSLAIILISASYLV